MLKQTWAISSVPKPMVKRSGNTITLCHELTHVAMAPQPLNSTTNSRHKPTPVTISAFIMGMLFTAVKVLRALRRIP